jgi:predicted RNA-binding Zn-ribbon protein involved in translation (DUF1610 family)
VWLFLSGVAASVVAGFILFFLAPMVSPRVERYWQRRAEDKERSSAEYEARVEAFSEDLPSFYLFAIRSFARLALFAIALILWTFLTIIIGQGVWVALYEGNFGPWAVFLVAALLVIVGWAGLYVSAFRFTILAFSVRTAYLESNLRGLVKMAKELETMTEVDGDKVSEPVTPEEDAGHIVCGDCGRATDVRLSDQPFRACPSCGSTSKYVLEKGRAGDPGGQFYPT